MSASPCNNASETSGKGAVPLNRAGFLTLWFKQKHRGEEEGNKETSCLTVLKRRWYPESLFPFRENCRGGSRNLTINSSSYSLGSQIFRCQKKRKRSTNPRRFRIMAEKVVNQKRRYGKEIDLGLGGSKKVFSRSKIKRQRGARVDDTNGGSSPFKKPGGGAVIGWA